MSSDCGAVQKSAPEITAKTSLELEESDSGSEQKIGPGTSTQSNLDLEESDCRPVPKIGSGVSTKIPRPPNAFLIFANLWRRKLAISNPEENNRQISVRYKNNMYFY